MKQNIIFDDVIKLRGIESNIIGRGLIIHADQDDCGNGGNAESLKTCNAGKRIAYAVIGYYKDNFKHLFLLSILPYKWYIFMFVFTCRYH